MPLTQRFNLLDGREARIETWNFSQLEGFLEQGNSIHQVLDVNVIDGFTFLGLHNISEIRREGRNYQYDQELRLSPLEQQPQRGLPNDAYHRSLAARVNDTVVGIALYQWIKGYGSFWRYFLRFVDVHEDFRAQGIATNIFRSTNCAPFLCHKILQYSAYTPLGKKCLSRVKQRELDGEHYALIPQDYCSPQPPTLPGIYNKYGQRISRDEIE